MEYTCTDRDKHTWLVYQNKVNKKWRWRRKAVNGRIVAAATEGYVNKADCIANAKLSGMRCTPK